VSQVDRTVGIRQRAGHEDAACRWRHSGQGA
jgi:hypothetical protein